MPTVAYLPTYAMSIHPQSPRGALHGTRRGGMCRVRRRVTTRTGFGRRVGASGPDDATQSVPCELIADLIAASHSTVQEGIISFNLHRQSWFSEYRRFLFQIQSLDAPGISEVAGTLRKEISAALDAEGSASVNTIELSRALSTECQIDLPASQFHFGG